MEREYLKRTKGNDKDYWHKLFGIIIDNGNT